MQRFKINVEMNVFEMPIWVLQKNRPQKFLPSLHLLTIELLGSPRLYTGKTCRNGGEKFSHTPPDKETLNRAGGIHALYSWSKATGAQLHSIGY